MAFDLKKTCPRKLDPPGHTSRRSVFKLEAIASLPHLALFSDEAHHAYGQKLLGRWVKIKGSEGWNCPSLSATALVRRLKSNNNFVLQAAARCLRQVPGNTQGRGLKAVAGLEP